ncbi:MAG: class I SAM-dependent methyltransferase [Ignavibacteria bacterium]
MQNDSWFKSWFNSPDYLRLYEHRDTRDAKKLINLLFRNIKLVKGASVLDLACGNGRHSILFARKGYKTTGLDLSAFLIKQAEKKRTNEYSRFKSNLKFEIKDMRDINHSGEFDLIVNLFTSFGYFKTVKDNEKVIKGISRALKQNGFFFFDFLNSSYLKKNLVPFDIKKFNGKSAIQIRTIAGGFVTKEIYIFSDRKPNHYYPEMLRFTERIKLFSFNELKKMFQKHHLKIIKVFGDYSGTKFNEKKSKRLIIIARKLV